MALPRDGQRLPEGSYQDTDPAPVPGPMYPSPGPYRGVRPGSPSAPHYGNPMPIVFGTARLPAQVVIASTRSPARVWRYRPADPASAQSFGSWETRDGWVTAAAYAIAEAPLTELLALWVNGRRYVPPAPAWAPSTVYAVGTRATYDEIVYRCTSAHTSEAGAPVIAGRWEAEGPHWNLLAKQGASLTVHLSDAPAIQPWFPALSAGIALKGTAWFGCEHFAIGEDGKLPTIEVEVRGRCLNAGGVDADPAEVVSELLTHPRWGSGFTVSEVDVDHGIDGEIASSFRTYCAAAGVGVSRAIVSQENAASLVDSLLLDVDAVPVWTAREGVGGLPVGTLVIVPWADRPVGTYRPPQWNEATQKIDAVLLDQHEIVFEEGQNPVTIATRPDDQTYDVRPVRFRNRAAEYEAAEVESGEGDRRAAAYEATWITNGGAALRLSEQLRARGIYSRNTYRFRILPRWAQLEPMDYVILREPKTGLEDVLCRITSKRTLPEGAIEIEAIETPEGMAAPVDLTPQEQLGFDSFTPAPIIPTLSDVAYSMHLSSAAHVLPASSDGTVTTYAGASTEITILRGNTDDTDAWTISRTDGPGVTSSLVGRVLTVSALEQGTDASWVEITATRDGAALRRQFVLSKAKQGAAGSAGTPGQRGSVTTSATAASAAWNDTTANNAITALTGSATRVAGDLVTLVYEPSNWSETRRWTGSAWVVAGVVIAGNAIAGGFMTSDYAEAGGVVMSGGWVRSNAGAGQPIVKAGPGGIQIGAFDATEPTIAALSALARTGTSDNDLVWYRGNSYGAPVLMDPEWTASTAYTVGDRVCAANARVYVCVVAGTSGSTAPTSTAAPPTQIADGSVRWHYVGTKASQERLLITSETNVAPVAGSVTGTWFLHRFRVKLRPRAATDNLDSMREVTFDLYHSSGTFIISWPVHFPDRAYLNRSVNDDALNETSVMVDILLPTGYSSGGGGGPFSGFARVTAKNSIGKATRDYQSAALGTIWAGGVSIPTQPAPPPPTEPDDPIDVGACVAPETLVQVAANGASVPAGELVAALERGDRAWVWTRPETGGPYDLYEVEAASIHLSERVRVVLDDGRELVVSPDHRVCSGAAWVHAHALREGVVIDGVTPGTVLRVQAAAHGPVVKLSIKKARTYVSAGLLSHNLKKR